MASTDRAVNRTGGDRDKSLETALAQIERQFGRGSIMRLGDEVRAPMEVIPTGSIALDVALGIGGLPRGRVVEIYGPEGSGKTTLALHAVASAQKAGGIAAFAAAYVARKIVAFVWTRTTGKEPPVHPEDPQVGIKEALGWAIVTGVVLESARLLATRAATKQLHAYQSGQPED